MAQVADQVVFEDFVEGLEVLHSWDRAALREMIGNAYGDQTERALDVLETRIRYMENVLKTSFDSVGAPAGGAARLNPLSIAEPAVAALKSIPLFRCVGRRKQTPGSPNVFANLRAC